MKCSPFLRQVTADIGGFILLLTGAVCVGLLVNQFCDHQLPLVYASKAVRVEDEVKQTQGIPESISVPDEGDALGKAATPQHISLDNFRRYVERKEGLVMDARPEIFHRLGHVPGALSFPREDFGGAYAKLRSRLETNKKQVLLVYCSDASCEDSQMVADGLTKLGYQRVFVFKGGWAEWTEANLPEEKTE
jgi:predicted sulfurtransferase